MCHPWFSHVPIKKVKLYKYQKYMIILRKMKNGYKNIILNSCQEQLVRVNFNLPSERSMSEKLILSSSSSIKSGSSSSTSSIDSVGFKLFVMLGNRKLLTGSHSSEPGLLAPGPVELKFCPGDNMPELWAGDLIMSVVLWPGDNRPVNYESKSNYNKPMHFLSAIYVLL